GAEGRLGEAHLQVVAEVRTPLAPGPRAAALPEDLAEDVPEDVVDVPAESGLERAGAESARRLVAEAVVTRALVRVAEDFVRLGGLLELLLGGLVAGILVRMVLEGELAERALQFLCGCGSGYPEHLVVVTLLRHLHSSDRQPSARPATSNVRTSEPLSILQINRQARQAREGIVLKPPKTWRGLLGGEAVQDLAAVFFSPASADEYRASAMR